MSQEGIPEELFEGMKRATGRHVTTDHVDWSLVASLTGDIKGYPLTAREMVTAMTTAVITDFPPNNVPDEVVARLEVVADLAIEMMVAVKDLGELMVKQLEAQGRNSNGQPIDHEAIEAQRKALAAHNEFKRKTAHRPDPADIKRKP
jgi:hypothetical protein